MRPLLHMVCAVALLLTVSTAGQQQIPDGFDDELVATVPFPTAMAATPDGRLLVATQDGKIFIYAGGALRESAALDLGSANCMYRERGLTGLAVDPDFALNRFVYVAYVFNRTGNCEGEHADAPVGRVSRFVLGDDGRVDRATELVLLDNIPSPIGVHNIGDVEVGPDGYLYVTAGDGGCDYAGDSGCFDSNDAAADLNVLVGKILRIARDGGVPPDNPYTGPGTVRCASTGQTDPGSICQEIFAAGLRNPWRIAFDPAAAETRFFINDVGQDTWEEINEGKRGADYGWNLREGFCANGSTTDCSPEPPPGLTNPIHAYDRAEGCASVTGGAFVPQGIWPSELDNAYVFGDYVCGAIFTLRPTGDGGYTRATLVSGLGDSSATDLMFGPSPVGTSLYYTTFAGGGQVRRLSHVAGGNRRPAASVSATPASGHPPLAVMFDASASVDPDGDPLTYRWDFGDGAASDGEAVAHHTYAGAGVFTATVHVTDAHGAEASASIRIDVGNTPPAPSIDSPAADHTFAVGDTIVLGGRAVDAEDGVLPGTALTWRVILHHNTHTHGFIAPTSGSGLTFQAPGPENLEAAATSHLEIELTATDSNGLTATVRQPLRPRMTPVTFHSQPEGATLRIDNAAVIAPVTFHSWVNFGVQVEAPAQQGPNGPLTFASWSDGGPAAHTIAATAETTSYTAVFTSAASTPGGPVADASSVENSHFPASLAVDGDLDTRWSSAFADPQWLRVDFGAARDLSRVVLHWETAHAAAYALQTSDDGVSWTTVFATASGDGGIDDVATPGARGRYLRVFGTARATEWGYSLYEVQVFGEGGGGGGGPFAGAATALPGTLQAEQFDEGGAGVAYADSSAGNDGGQFRATDVDIEATADAGGGFNVGWIAPGEWLRYTVHVQSAGDYRLDFRVASQGRGGTFHLVVDGVDRTGPLVIPDTGGWQMWTSVAALHVPLAAGAQTWTVVFDALGPDGVVGNLNYIAVQPASAAASSPVHGTPVALPGVVQAEDFDHGGAGVAYMDASGGNEGGAYRPTDVDVEPTTDAGGGFNVGWIAPGEWLKYSVAVATAGAYDVDVRVAAEGPGGTFHIEVDGIDRTGPLVIPDTGSWQSWTTVTARSVGLAAGPQVWTLVFDGASPGGVVGNVNHLTVSSSSSVPSVTLVRAPYLQQVTPTSAIVMWTTREAAAGAVRYASAGSGAGTATASRTVFAAEVTGLASDYHQYEARISGLVPGATYSYTVLANGADLPGTASSLRTAPARGSGAIRFVAFGDSGVGSTAQAAIGARLAADTFDLAVHTGDVAYGGTDGFGGGTYATYESWVFGAYAPWMRSRPFYPSIGNHDDETDAAAPYRSVFSLPAGGATSTFPDHAERYYSFDYGPVHFVALDTETAFADASRRAAMLAWLEADLAATTQPWRIAYFHRPPYSAGPHHGSNLAVRAAFSPLFERYGVQLVLTGHEHMYERTQPWREHVSGGSFVTYVITGGGGAGLHPTGWAPWTAATASRHHYVRVAVDPCVLTGEAVGTDGSAFDTFRIVRCIP